MFHFSYETLDKTHVKKRSSHDWYMEDPYLLFMLENFGYLDLQIHHFFAHCVDECHTTYDHVRHKVSHTKTLATKKRKIYWYLVKIVDNWKPSELPLQMHDTQDIFCILIPQLSKFWKTEFETADLIF